MIQAEIDWSNIANHRENNSHSEALLNDNYERLNKQCKKVYDLLKSGHSLTVRGAVVDHNINSLPRRILDLKQAGIEIRDRIINRKYKEYYL